MIVEHPRFWPIVLALGLEPISGGAPRSTFCDGDIWTPIITALYSLQKHADNTRKTQIIVDSLAKMIRKGADIYDVHWADEERFDYVEDGIMTPTAYARYLDDGVVPLWEAALRRAGLNPLYVYAEDARRRREFLKTHGATRSAVDVDLGQESSQLRLRRAHEPETRYD